MKNQLVTPLGEIKIYVDGTISEFIATPYQSKYSSPNDTSSAICYKIDVSCLSCHSIRCVLESYDFSISNIAETGERYYCLTFIKEQVSLTIGAEDENLNYETKDTANGIEYALKHPIDTVTFNVAWVIDYNRDYDIRTYLAADNF